MCPFSWRYALSGLVGLALLAGCANRQPIPRYVSPTGVPAAKFAVRGYGADLYGVFLYTNNETCTQPQIVGSGRRNAEPPTSVNLPAGQWATVDFVALDQVRRTECRVRWSFQPVADRTYVLSGMANANSCAARVYDATNPDDMKLEASAVQRNAPGSSCLSIADAQERKRKLNASNPAAGSKDEPMLAPSATTHDLKDLIGK